MKSINTIFEELKPFIKDENSTIELIDNSFIAIERDTFYHLGIKQLVDFCDVNSLLMAITTNNSTRNVRILIHY